MACFVTRPRANARPCPMALTAREAVRMTPRVALARDSTRLACRSPSNRTLRKWLTCRKPRVRSGFIDRPANRVACREIRGSRARGNRFMSSGRLRIQPGRCDSFQKATAPRLILLLPEEFKLEMRGCMRQVGAIEPLIGAVGIDDDLHAGTVDAGQRHEPVPVLASGDRRLAHTHDGLREE